MKICANPRAGGRSIDGIAMPLNNQMFPKHKKNIFSD